MGRNSSVIYRSVYALSITRALFEVFLQTGVGILINLFSICLKYTCVFYCLNQTRRWISTRVAICRLGDVLDIT